MDLLEVEQLSADINNIKNNINEELNRFPRMPRVIMIGLTGSGKSSLANCLSQRELIIREGIGMRIEVQGEGVRSGSSSITQFPELFVDQSTNLIYCDCPGFEDSRGFKQEIINSYAIDQLLQQINNECCLIKILLIVSMSEFDTGRGQGILKSIERLTRIFPNIEDIKRSIGIVITKSEQEVSGINYLLRIQDNSDEILNEWCNYFIQNPHQIFTFPMALRRNIGQQYTDFEDKFRLIEFLQTDQLINPIHNVGLSENSILRLREIGNHQMANALKCTQELFQLIAQQYQNEDQDSTLSAWINLIRSLLQADLNNVNHFIHIIQEHNLNDEIFNQYFDRLQNSETLNIFIGNVLNENLVRNCVCDSIRSQLRSTLQELNIHLNRQRTLNRQHDQIEQQVREIQNKNEVIELKNQEIDKTKKKVIISSLVSGLSGAAVVSSGMVPALVEIAKNPETWNAIGELITLAFGEVRLI